MMRVDSASGEESGTWGFGCGKQGCEAPQVYSSSASPSPGSGPMPTPEEVGGMPLTEAGWEFVRWRWRGREAREEEGLRTGRPASRSCGWMEGSDRGGGSSMPAALANAPDIVGGECSGEVGAEGGLLRLSGGNAMLVLPLLSSVDGSTTREEWARLARLRRCSGSVRRG